MMTRDLSFGGNYGYLCYDDMDWSLWYEDYDFDLTRIGLLIDQNWGFYENI